MVLEFIKDSEELKSFVKSLKYVEADHYYIDSDDDSQEYIAIYIQLETKKYYSVEMRQNSGVYNKAEFVSHRRNFKASEPYVVRFIEVKPKQVTVTKWEPIDEMDEKETE